MTAFDSTRREAPRLPRDDFDVPFEEALRWARERKAVLPEEFYGARLQAVRARSFSIAGLSALDQLQQVADSLAEATAAGQTMREWQRTLPSEVFSLGRARRELIFRNAVQTHYGIGRTIQQRENATARPFLMWDAINDSRTRPAHSAMDGFIAPVDDPIWQRWSPPAGHNSVLPWQRVSGNALIGLKARYSGPVVEVIGDSGARISVTSKHPILTARGWIAAEDIKVGDKLVRYCSPIGAGSVPADAHEDDAPPTIEQVFDALRLRASGSVPRSALNLHGDAQFIDGNVEVVAANRQLMDRVEAVRAKSVDQLKLALTDDAASMRQSHGAGAVVARSQLGSGATNQSSAQAPICGPVAVDDYAPTAEEGRQALAVDAQPPLQVSQSRALAVEVAHLLRDLGAKAGGRSPHGASGDECGGLRFGPLGDTAFADVFIGGFEINPDALSDVMERHAGFVEFEDVVNLRLWNWSGHVYDLETASGNILAYGGTGRHHYLISNCRCTRISLTEAQARARGYPKADPGVEPDKGWAGDPTDDDAAGRILADRIARAPYSMAEALRLRGRGAPVVDDQQRNAPDCDLLDGSRFAAEWCIGPRPGQVTWKDAGRPDLRRVDDALRLVQPAMLPRAESRADAAAVLAKALGLSDAEPLLSVATPVENALLRVDLLQHMVDKEEDARERYANFILPTLRDPFEVWAVDYADGIRNRYIGLFRGPRDFMVVLRVNLDGSLTWNIMQARPKDMNMHRIGALRYGK